MIVHKTTINCGIKGIDPSVEIEEDKDGTLWAKAYNEAGYNWTFISIADLLEWLIKHKPNYIQSKIKNKEKMRKKNNG